MLEPRERALIQGSRLARLGTIGPGGRPHLVPVCFALVGSGFASPIDQKPKRGPRLARLRNIERDARVTLLFDYYDEDWSRLAWLRVDGTAVVLARGDAWPEALQALRQRYQQYRTMDLETCPVIRITVERTASWHASSG